MTAIKGVITKYLYLSYILYELTFSSYEQYLAL